MTRTDIEKVSKHTCQRKDFKKIKAINKMEYFWPKQEEQTETTFIQKLKDNAEKLETIEFFINNPHKETYYKSQKYNFEDFAWEHIDGYYGSKEKIKAQLEGEQMDLRLQKPKAKKLYDFETRETRITQEERRKGMLRLIKNDFNRLEKTKQKYVHLFGSDEEFRKAVGDKTIFEFLMEKTTNWLKSYGYLFGFSPSRMDKELVN